MLGRLARFNGHETMSSSEVRDESFLSVCGSVGQRNRGMSSTVGTVRLWAVLYDELYQKTLSQLGLRLLWLGKADEGRGVSADPSALPAGHHSDA